MKEIRTTIQARQTVCTASGFPETGFSTPHGWPPIPAPPPDSPLESERRRPAFEMFVAETRCREFFDSSIVRTDAQSCAQLESSRARVPYTADSKFSPPTALRRGARTNYRTRYPAAYGHPRLWAVSRSVVQHRETALGAGRADAGRGPSSGGIRRR